MSVVSALHWTYCRSQSTQCSSQYLANIMEIDLSRTIESYQHEIEADACRQQTYQGNNPLGRGSDGISSGSATHERPPKSRSSQICRRVRLDLHRLRMAQILLSVNGNFDLGYESQPSQDNFAVGDDLATYVAGALSTPRQARGWVCH
jgi:hypothetical protein